MPGRQREVVLAGAALPHFVTTLRVSFIGSTSVAEGLDHDPSGLFTDHSLSLTTRRFQVQSLDKFARSLACERRGRSGEVMWGGLEAEGRPVRALVVRSARRDNVILN